MLSAKYCKKAELKNKELELKKMELELQKQKYEAGAHERKVKFEMEVEERKAIITLLKDRR